MLLGRSIRTWGVPNKNGMMSQLKPERSAGAKEMRTSTNKTWQPYLTQFDKELFRELSPEETEIEKNAILWLAKRKRLKASEITRLQFRQVDEQKKTVRVTKTGKYISLTREISYEGTPLEKQIQNAREVQRSSFLVFSRAARRGKVRTFTPGLRTQEVQNLISVKKENSRKRIWTKSEGKSIMINIKW